MKWLEANKYASKEEYMNKKTELENVCEKLMRSGGMPGEDDID